MKGKKKRWTPRCPVKSEFTARGQHEVAATQPWGPQWAGKVLCPPCERKTTPIAPPFKREANALPDMQRPRALRHTPREDSQRAGAGWRTAGKSSGSKPRS